jgi:hypothetical protein
MNLIELKRKLIAAARQNKPSDRVPYAFEKRVLAQLAARPALDVWVLWARALWRSAGACLAVMFLCGAFSLFTVQNRPAGSASDLSQDFENTLLAAVNQDID